MALTAKQQRFVDESLNEKIAALRLLATHLGLIAPCSALAVSREEQARRIKHYGAEPILCAVQVLMSQESSPQAKAASGLFLECFVPDWRELLGPAAYGSMLERGDSVVRDWRTNVLNRDDFTCKECGSKDNLHAHHIVRWADCPELRVELSNGITLCKSCHEAEHAKTR